MGGWDRSDLRGWLPALAVRRAPSTASRTRGVRIALARRCGWSYGEGRVGSYKGARLAVPPQIYSERSARRRHRSWRASQRARHVARRRGHVAVGSCRCMAAFVRAESSAELSVQNAENPRCACAASGERVASAQWRESVARGVVTGVCVYCLVFLGCRTPMERRELPTDFTQKRVCGRVGGAGCAGLCVSSVHKTPPTSNGCASLLLRVCVRVTLTAECDRDACGDPRGR